jgi:RND family efflux transporter MFP subunit
MDPVDLDEHIRAQDATLKQADAQLNEALVRRDYAQTQALRYEQLLQARSTSEEVVATKQHDLLVAKAGLTAAREELSRVRAEREALAAQRNNLYLIAPVDGLVVSRDAEPGTTVVAGQAVVELIDPNTLWVNVRFDQIRAQGLAPGLSAQIALRSQAGEQKAGRVLRVEPLADAVTEETLAKVVFDQIPDPLPPVGELVEVTVTLPTLGATPIVPNAAIHNIDGRLGVWQVTHDDLHFTPVSLGIADLEGRVQIQEGLKAGDRIVAYSENTLNEHSRIHIVDHIPGVTP